MSAIVPSDHLPVTGTSLLDALETALVALDDRLTDLTGLPGPQATIWLRLTDLSRQLGVVTDRLEQMLLAECPARVNRAGREVRDRLVIDGVAVVEPVDRGGRWVSADYTAALAAVFDAAGIRVLDEDRAVMTAWEAAELVCEVVSMSGLRCNKREGTGLAAYGLDRDRFAAYVEGTPGVRIVTS